METLIVHPDNEAQLTAVKAVLKALNISFEKKKYYDSDFVKKIKDSETSFRKGKFKTVKTEDLWK